MPTPTADVSETFLTERQAEVLAMREAGRTQREIADRLGTSVANVSGVESAARRNVARAQRTVVLGRLLACSVRFRAEAGRDLRALVDEIYARGDATDLRVAHAEPELTTRLHDLLGDRIDARRLTEPVEVGLTADGEVVAVPATAVEERGERTDAAGSEPDGRAGTDTDGAGQDTEGAGPDA